MCGLDRSSGVLVDVDLKHVLKLHVQYLPKYSYTRYIHPLLERTLSPKYNKAQSKRNANPREANTSKHRRHLSLV